MDTILHSKLSCTTYKVG